jgi:hypothetical protein
LNSLLFLFLFFRHIRVVVKSAYYILRVRPSVRIYQCGPTCQISAKFGIGYFYKNLSGSYKFNDKWTKASRNLRERPQYVLLLPASFCLMRYCGGYLALRETR